MVKGLTKANVSKYGIEVREDLDFNDDGNRFRGFSYKGMPMTQCKYQGVCYLSIRVDYLSNNFTYKEWSKTEESKLTDKFNGVCEFDIDELIENLEIIIAKVDEMNANASIDESDINKAIELINEEIESIQNVIKFAKTDLKWWNVSSEYEMKNIKNYISILARKIETGKSLIETRCDSENMRKAKYHIERMKTSGTILDYKFYKEEIIRIVNKYAN